MIVQDLRPVAMLYLGALLNIDQVCFEHYFNRDASFETFDPNVLFFNYLETLLYGGASWVVLGHLSETSKARAREIAVKIWMIV